MRVFSTVKDPNLFLLKREFLSDLSQNLLKLGTYFLSHSQAVKAELMRNLLDTANHGVLYYADKWSRQTADANYNYGYSKFKNLAVISPGICFGVSGVYNLFSGGFHLLIGNFNPAGLTLGAFSLSVLFLCSLSECYITYKNIADLRPNEKLSFRDRLALSYRIVAYKEKLDPIQSTIIIENLFAIGGVSIAAITSVICYVTGSAWIDLLGQMLNGAVQI